MSITSCPRPPHVKLLYPHGERAVWLAIVWDWKAAPKALSIRFLPAAGLPGLVGRRKAAPSDYGRPCVRPTGAGRTQGRPKSDGAAFRRPTRPGRPRSEEHTSELQSHLNLT